MAYKGKFVPVNKSKYKGNWRNITYRSHWELHMFKWCDRKDVVKRWNSEETVIPYFSDADGKKRRYFMDLYVEFTTGETVLFEIKPIKETKAPKPPSRMTAKAKQRFMTEDYNWHVNNDKWNAAIALCKQRGWKFKILTEVTLAKNFGYKGLPRK